MEQALADPRVSVVVAPTRRALAPRPGLINPVVDFDRLPQDADWWAVDAVVCTLGTTARKAGSPAAFYRVDHDHPLEVAYLARRHGAQAYALNSALGADAASRVFYLRTKGEIERDLQAVREQRCRQRMRDIATDQAGADQRVRIDDGDTQRLAAAVLDHRLVAGRERLQRRGGGIDLVGVDPGVTFTQAAFFLGFQSQAGQIGHRTLTDRGGRWQASLAASGAMIRHSLLPVNAQARTIRRKPDR